MDNRAYNNKHVEGITMDVTFKGIQNIGAINMYYNGGSAMMHRIILELNNNKTPDLMAFQKLLEVCPHANKNVLQIDVFVNPKNKVQDFCQDQIAVNGMMFPAKMINMPVFNNLKVLLSDVVNMGKKEEMATKEYMYGGMFKKNTIPTLNGEEEVLDATALEEFHDPESVKVTADVMQKRINEVLNFIFMST